MIGYLYPSKKATPDRVPSYTDYLVSLLSHLTKHLPALTKVQQRNVVTLLTLLLSLLGLTLSFFLYTHVCSWASSHLKLKSIETEEFQVETLEEPASVSSKNYLWVILSFLTRTKDVPEEGGKEIKEMEEIENIKQVKEIDINSGIEVDETNHDVSISAKEVIAAKATFKEKLLNFFRIATRSNTEQDPVIDEIIEEVAAQLEEETVDTILETTEITEEAVEEITDEDEKVDNEIEVPEEEKTEDDQIQDNNVDVFDESCDNLPEEPSLRDTLWGLLGCGVTIELEGDSDVDVIEEAAEEIVEVTGEPEEEITESEEDIPTKFDVIEQEVIENLVGEPDIITEVKIEDSESHLAEESCDNLPEEPSLRDTLWGFLGCGGPTEVAENSVLEDNEEIQIEEATEEISIEEATEMEIQTESETEIEAISTYEPETQTEQITEEAEVLVEESCDNLPTEPSLRDKLWSFLGCGNTIEEVANSEEEVIEDEVLSETTHDTEIEQMETDQVDILTTEEPNVEETIVSTEEQTEENVSLQEEVVPADIHLQIKG